MAGVRRRLQQVSKTVSGVLGVRLGEGASTRAAGGAPAPGAGEPAGGGEIPDEQVGAVPEPGEQAAALDAADAGAGAEAGELPPTAPVAEVVAAEPVEPDAVLTAAVQTARAAALEVGGAAVGEHLGGQVEPVPAGTGGAVLTHFFASTDRAYVGWRWAVTVARAEGTEQVTVDEVVLLPGAGALIAPAWVPYSERVQPGDLSAGDVLPAPADDERLVPAYADPEAELADEVGWQLGLGRPRVLSREGRADAAARWMEGEGGPLSPVARQAPGRCADCGFLVPLAGALRSAFGVCANALAPDDGRVVALAHGCGAHSETVVDPAHAATTGMAVQDEFELLPVSAGPSVPPPAASDDVAPSS